MACDPEIVNVGTVGILAAPGMLPITLKVYYFDDDSIRAFMQWWRRGHKFVTPISYAVFQKMLNAAYPHNIICEYVEIPDSTVVHDVKNNRYLEHRKEVKACAGLTWKMSLTEH